MNKFNIIEIPNFNVFQNNHKEEVMYYNWYMVKDLEQILEENHRNIYYIIEQKVYIVVSNQTLTEYINERAEQ